ncbi:MAG: hypothetical protein HY831_01915 [Candidatus Aenigmarchaeota archaeon]|nr:hypothetical protein [Candidatus Aenigmarchaeota archaeon]
MICPLCSGKRPVCIHEYNMLPKIFPKTAFSKEFFGPSYNIFVVRVGYPNVSLGPMASSEKNLIVDDPSKWFGLPYEQIIEMRYLLIRTKSRVNIKQDSRFIEENQLIILSKPIDIEMVFKKHPVYRWEFSDTLAPNGPIADIDTLRLAENPKIPVKLEKIVSDELKASDASVSIYNTGEDVYKLSSILSSGVLGLEKNKKLVPSRWSITAVDDIITKSLISGIKDFKSVDDYIVFTSQYLDNHFEVLVMPGNWEFENFEAWIELGEPKILEEYEAYSGRKKYADLQAGGYYASRLAIVEGLHKMKRQGKAIGFREIYEGYSVAVGVWQVRENVRNAMRQEPKKFATLEEALRDINTRLRIPINKDFHP